jgi:hypothetical protein
LRNSRWLGANKNDCRGQHPRCVHRSFHRSVRS